MESLQTRLDTSYEANTVLHALAVKLGNNVNQCFLQQSCVGFVTCPTRNSIQPRKKAKRENQLIRSPVVSLRLPQHYPVDYVSYTCPKSFKPGKPINLNFLQPNYIKTQQGFVVDVVLFRSLQINGLENSYMNLTADDEYYQLALNHINGV